MLVLISGMKYSMVSIEAVAVTKWSLARLAKTETEPSFTWLSPSTSFNAKLARFRSASANSFVDI